jgi:hypothetical protein
VKQLIAAVTFFLAVAVVSAADVSGSWNVDGDVASHAVKFVCTLKQEGEKLSGVLTIEGAETPVTGSVRDKAVSFTFDVNYQGQVYTNVFTGTLKDEGAIEGTIEVGGASGTFTAKKQPR